MRRGSRFIPRWSVLLAASGLAWQTALAQPGMSRRELPSAATAIDPASEEDVAAWVAILGTGSASDRARLEAAKSLVRHAPEIGVFSAIERALATPFAGVGGGRYIMAAIEDATTPPPVLAALLAQRAEGADEAEVARILGALGGFRSREAAKTLVRYAGSPDPRIARAALDALAAMAGANGVEHSAEAWAAWLDRASALDELGWSRMLLDSVARAQRESAAREAATKARLIETLRKLHIETAPEHRSELVSSMLRDADVDVQRVAIDLVRRELSVNGSLDAAVADAAIELLKSPVATIRADAAVLVRQLGVDAGEAAVFHALQAETDPNAAANLLMASARWPRPSGVEPVLRWMREPACRSAAAEAAWALVRTATMADADARRVFAMVKAQPTGGLSAPEIQLIGALGKTEDLEALVPLLQSAKGTVQRAAADALVWDEETYGAVIAAAASDANLFEAATTAILVHEPTIEGFQIAFRLPVVSEELRQDRLAALSHGMSAADVLAASELSVDKDLRRSLLSAITSDARIASERGRPEALAAICEAIVRLGEDDVAAGRHEAALGRFELCPFVFEAASADRASALRCVCLVALGRLTAAVDLACDPGAWMRGLDGAAGRSYELSIVETIETEFDQQLDEGMRARLKTVRERIAAANAPR